MISKHDLAKALSNKAREIATANGYNLIANNEQYTPDVNEEYIQQFTLGGPSNALGMEDDSPDLQFGVYQISVHTPKSSRSAEWDGLKIAEKFQLGFKRGTELVYNNQMVRTKESDIQPLKYDPTHLMHVLSVRYSVIN